VRILYQVIMDILQIIVEDAVAYGQKSPTSLIALLLFLGWLGWILRPRSYSNGSNVPMVAGGYPFIGHALEFDSNTEKFLQRCNDEYGSIFGFRIMGHTFVFLDSSYKETYFVSNSNELSFQEAVLRAVVPQFTIGMDAILHEWHIPIIRRQMSPNRVSQFYTTIQEQIQHTLCQELGALEPGDSRVHEDVAGLTSRIVAACSAVSFLGSELGREKEILHVFLHFHSACFRIMSLAFVVPHSMLWIFAHNVNTYRMTLRRWIVPEVKKRRATENLMPSSDLLSVMIQLTVSGKLLTAEQIADRCMSLIFASMVTTAGVLRHAVYDLAGYWDRFSEQLIQEQKQVIALHGSAMTPTALGAMQQLNAFMNESMRLSGVPIQHTRVFMKGNREEKSLMEKNHQIRLPKGATICMSGYLLTHDPKVFVDPREFHIERFLQDNSDPESLGLFPFGIGRHSCPGRFFARAEVQSTLCTLLRHYRVRTVSGQVPKYRRVPVETSRIQESVQFTKVTD
jgi:cytochrome P450